MSAAMRTPLSFAFTYGRVEARAKMPAGDWIWPAIWMMPVREVYGNWPTSGEIDIVESRGNADLLRPSDNVQVGEFRRPEPSAGGAVGAEADGGLHGGRQRRGGRVWGGSRDA